MSDFHHIETFLEMLSAERGAALNTIDAYRRDLSDFSASISKSGKSVVEVGADDIRQYLGTLVDQGLAASSTARKLSAVRQFFKFLYAEGVRSDNPATVIDRPRLARPLPKTLSVEDVEQLLEHSKQQVTIARPSKKLGALRLNCLVEITYATGLRVSELVGLPITAATSDERFLFVRGKGGRERLVPLSEPAKQAMVAYVREGVTTKAVNFPEVTLPPLAPGRTRMAHVHENVPGVLSSLNDLFSDTGLNITGQALGTTSAIGYVLTDLEGLAPDKAASADLAARARAITGAVRVRLLNGG